jgi:hypothetical protein
MSKATKERARRRERILEVYGSAPGKGMPAAIDAANALRVDEAMTAAQAPRATAAAQPLSAMNTEDVASLGAAWFGAQARSGHVSPFWQVPEVSAA